MERSSEMPIIKLMADYNTSVLWHASPGKVGDINPDTLPITPKLKEHCKKLSQFYTATLNPDDPVASGFKTVKQRDRFNLLLKRTAEDLKRELPNIHFVVKEAQ